MSILHRLAHLFGVNSGRVHSWHEGEKIMVGFRCEGCNTIEGVHERRIQAGCITTLGPSGCYRVRCNLSGKCVAAVEQEGSKD